MSKQLKVTYNPNEGDPAVIRQFGVTLEAGKAVAVPEDHPQADKFRNNPTFSVEGQDPPVRDDTDHRPTERDAIIARLEGRGVKVDRRLGLGALQEQENETNAKAQAAAEKAAAEA